MISIRGINTRRKQTNVDRRQDTGTEKGWTQTGRLASVEYSYKSNKLSQTNYHHFSIEFRVQIDSFNLLLIRIEFLILHIWNLYCLFNIKVLSSVITNVSMVNYSHEKAFENLLFLLKQLKHVINNEHHRRDKVGHILAYPNWKQTEFTFNIEYLNIP